MNSDLEYLIGRARELSAELDPDVARTPEQLAYWAGQARYVLGQLASVAGYVNA